MDKGYYLLCENTTGDHTFVAIHNKNGQGLLQQKEKTAATTVTKSQSTIKMDKGYYTSSAIS